jgi:uncharacterized protein with von Willebrand factor type A (vWA) domain
VEGFYYLARAALVKDERHIDRFDQVFSHCFRGVEAVGGADAVDVRNLPEEWLRRMAEKHLSEDEKKLIESLGGFDKLMETLKQRLEEQQKRHQGGSKWIGTAGTSPFGAYGYNPEGVRIGQDESRHRRAIKVWDKREFKEPRRHRRAWHPQHQGGAEKAPQRGCARARPRNSTCRHHPARPPNMAGSMSRPVPERRNAVKLLMFFDVGGSMDDHIRVCRGAVLRCPRRVPHMEYFYFHNCLYEGSGGTITGAGRMFCRPKSC